MNPAQIYQKYLDGLWLTDLELAYGIDHFDKLAAMLNSSGERFVLCAREASRTAGTMLSFQISRERNENN